MDTDDIVFKPDLRTIWVACQYGIYIYTHMYIYIIMIIIIFLVIIIRRIIITILIIIITIYILDCEWGSSTGNCEYGNMNES